MSSLLSGIATGIRISPVYVFLGTVGASFAVKDVWEDRELSEVSKIGLAQVGLSLISMRLNLTRYRRIVGVLQSKGYRPFALNPCLQSFCGRRILSAAAKDNQIHHLYKQHLIDQKIKWYQFNSNPVLNKLLPLGTVAFTVSAISYGVQK